MDYSLENYEQIKDAAKKVSERASKELDQECYNTGWLTGYAAALNDIVDQFVIE